MVYGPGYELIIYPAKQDFDSCGLCSRPREHGDWLCEPCKTNLEQLLEEDTMQDIGKPFDHGLPPEVEADPDLEALKCAAELVGRALEQVGSTAIVRANLITYPLLDEVKWQLHRLIERMEAKEERHEDSVPEMRF